MPREFRKVRTTRHLIKTSNLAPGLIIFVMARLAFPQKLDGIDLRVYYFEQSRVI